MKILAVLCLFSALLIPSIVHAEVSPSPHLEIEKKIAYGQGRLGALYARCGAGHEKAFIGGSLANWRDEALRGYRGTALERSQMEQAFDVAVERVNTDNSICKNWSQQASTTWDIITRLARSGKDTASF